MFNNKLQKLALEAMDRLISHPIASPFRSPIIPGEEPENYFQIIPNPRNLDAIRQSLEEGKYHQIQEWFDDVELVWTNCDSYYSADSSKQFTTPSDRKYFSVVTTELRRIFAKEKRIFTQFAIGNWSHTIYELRTEVTDLMTQLPDKLKQFTSSLGKARTIKQSISTINEKELNILARIANGLTSVEDQKEMIRIVTANQPELDTGEQELRVDITKLSIPTIQTLKEFMKNALQRQGEKYPE
jgi:hypothetical protein